jgi:hypothetical protein
VQRGQRLFGVLAVLKNQRRGGIFTHHSHDGGELRGILTAKIVELVGNRNQAGQTDEDARRKYRGKNQFAAE